MVEGSSAQEVLDAIEEQGRSALLLLVSVLLALGFDPSDLLGMLS